jgi:histidyl-tRNA synthetase
MDISKKNARPKAITPKGFRDNFHSYLKKRDEVLEVVNRIYELYGFERLETSAVETVDALGKFLPDINRPNEGVFAWQDENDSWLALRYDLTAPLARAFSQHRNRLQVPYKRYSFGPVWRNEKPGPDRFKEFYQFDADIVGTSSFMADAEMCFIVFDVLKELGFSVGDYCTRISNRKILSGLIQAVKLADDTVLGDIELVVFRAIDKLDRLGLEGVKSLLGKGRTDISGAFTEGANLSSDQIDTIIRFLKITNDDPYKTLEEMQALIGDSQIGQEGLIELRNVADTLLSKNISDHSFKIDPSVVRGLAYYTGTVFETELFTPSRSLGSISGGGRYDDLVSRFTGQKVPSTGVSIGIDRLVSFLHERDSNQEKGVVDVIVTVMDKNLMKHYVKIAADLRENGINTDLYVGNTKDFGKQMKYADSRGAAFAIVAGTNEVEDNIVQIKDLKLGRKLSTDISSNEEWKAQPAQFPIRRDALVEKILELLRR